MVDSLVLFDVIGRVDRDRLGVCGSVRGVALRLCSSDSLIALVCMW